MKYVFKFIRRFVENPYGLFIRESGQVPVGASAGNPQDISELESRAASRGALALRRPHFPHPLIRDETNENIIFALVSLKPHNLRSE